MMTYTTAASDIIHVNSWSDACGTSLLQPLFVSLSRALYSTVHKVSYSNIGKAVGVFLTQIYLWEDPFKKKHNISGHKGGELSQREG
jgi:hypothetical protein